MNYTEKIEITIINVAEVIYVIRSKLISEIIEYETEYEIMILKVKKLNTKAFKVICILWTLMKNF
jgi:hypothetical protein